MTERSTLDSFEQRVAAELEPCVAPATDPKSATEIAAVAMRPRGLVVRVRNVSGARRFRLLGLAATLLLPAAYIGAARIRPPAPDLLNQVQPPRTDGPRSTAATRTNLPFRYVSLFLRRDDGPEPGVSIFAVRPDGAGALVRKVPDTILPEGDKLSEWGTASKSGWLALASDHSPWPMILVDLRDEHARPWVVTEASTGGIGPRWGPTGLVAADAGSNGGRVVIGDLETHTTRIVSMRGGLVGGGPSIVWTADGSGIVGSTGSGAFQVVPIDGGDPRPGVGEVFDPRGGYGPGLAALRTCSPMSIARAATMAASSASSSIGRPRRSGGRRANDRALAAGFGGRADEYWLTVDRASGRQAGLVHLHDGRQDAVATVNRDAAWQSLGAPLESPDQSTLLVWIDLGAKPAAVLVPLTGESQTFHTGQFAGFVDSATSAAFASGQFGAPSQTLPAAGQAYRLPSLDDLISAELGLNPGRRVLGKASREAVAGQTDVRTFEVVRDQSGAGEVYLDCVGPSSVAVTVGPNSVTSPCLRAGSYVGSIDVNGPIIVSASGDTSWRAVIYSP